MKKSLTVIAIAALGLASLQSCGKKAQTSESEEAAPETISLSTESIVVDPVISEAQKNSLTDSKLVNDFDKTVIIDFNAVWCGPCKTFAPYFEAAAEKYGDKATFVSIDVDNYREVADAFDIQAIPTVIIIMPDGKYIQYVGTGEILGEDKFDKIVEEHI